MPCSRALPSCPNFWDSTVRTVTPRVLEPPLRVGTGLSVYPAATAMVWPGEGHPHEAVAVPGVQLGPGEALVEVELATICDSDVHSFLGERPAPTPLILGHEQVGRVVALGQGGAKSTDGRRLSIGSRVVWSVAVPCGRCVRCRRGLGQKCLDLHRYGHERMRRGWELTGGFATHVHVLASTPIVVVPEEVPAVVLAPASCSTATAAAALQAAAEITPLPDSLIVVAGAGMLGLTVTAMASDAGAHVVVIEPDERRRTAALAFGARAVVDARAVASNGSGSNAARGSGLNGSAPHGARGSGSHGSVSHGAASGGSTTSRLAAALQRAGGRGTSCTIGIETSGTRGAALQLLDAMDIGGVVVLAGSASPGPEIPLDPDQLARRLLTVRGVHDYSPQHLERAIAFLTDAWRRFPFADQVRHTVPLRLIDEALELATSGVAPRIAVSPRA